MGTDDRIDDALRAIAQAEASRGFSDQVRSRIEAGDGARVGWWPRLVAASVATGLLASLVWVSRDAPAPPPMAAVAVPSPAPDSSPQAALEPATEVASPAPVVRRRARTAPMTTSDHERALQPLLSLDPIALPSLAPAAMVVRNRDVVPLAPIAPLPVPELFADDDGGER